MGKIYFWCSISNSFRYSGDKFFSASLKACSVISSSSLLDDFDFTSSFYLFSVQAIKSIHRGPTPEQNQLNYPRAFNIFRPVEQFSCLFLARSCYFTSLPTFHAQFFVISCLYNDFRLRDSFNWAHDRLKSLAFDNIRWGPCFKHFCLHFGKIQYFLWS